MLEAIILSPFSRSFLRTFLFLSTTTLAIAHDLAITPVQQLRSEWCWLAVGEMVLRNAGVPQFPGSPDYQCGMLMANPRYGSCPNIPAGSTGGIRSLVYSYPAFVNSTGLGSAPAGVISYSHIKHEIQNNRPVIIGVNPSQVLVGIPNLSRSYPLGPGSAEHAALIIGFDEAANSITVADPYPYPPAANPYLKVGAVQIDSKLAYRLTWDQLVVGLKWVNSLHCLEPVNPSAPGKPASCW